MIRDRITELRRVPASELRPHPRNWRRHPERQSEALRAMLEDVGFADALLARETPEGLELIDGHLRAGLDPDQLVPVLVLDVDEAEAGALLATLDPLTAMAEWDDAALASLLTEVEIPAEMLAALSEELPDPEPAAAPSPPDSDGRLNVRRLVTCPECGHEFSTPA